MKNAPKIVTPITDGESLRKIEVRAYCPIPGRLKIVSVMNDPARTTSGKRPRRSRNPARSLRFPALDGVG